MRNTLKKRVMVGNVAKKIGTDLSQSKYFEGSKTEMSSDLFFLLIIRRKYF
jgi:hypothetical protein